MENEKLKELAKKFRDRSEQAMLESDAANHTRNWVKGDLKEREAKTWLEAHRMTKKLYWPFPETKSERWPEDTKRRSVVTFLNPNIT